MILAVLVMLAGLIGTVAPFVPGLPIIWLAFLGYGFYDHWESFGLTTMIITGVVVALSLILDQLATMWGAKRFGAGKAGMIGSIAGGILGLVIFNIPGMVLGAFAGAVICEMQFGGQDFKESLQAGAGALLGLLVGSLGKFVMGSMMILAFLWLVIFG